MKVDGIKVHDKKVCVPPCPFHAPSDHPLKEARLHFRADRGFLVERICEHGVGHPDPDSIDWMRRNGGTPDATHGCDGCCAPPTDTPAQSNEREEQINDVVQRLFGNLAPGISPVIAQGVILELIESAERAAYNQALDDALQLPTVGFIDPTNGIRTDYVSRSRLATLRKNRDV